MKTALWDGWWSDLEGKWAGELRARRSGIAGTSDFGFKYQGIMQLSPVLGLSGLARPKPS